MDLLPEVLIPLLIIGGFVYLFVRRNRERAENAPLRGEIEARVCFETTLYRASILGTGGFEGTRGVWIQLKGPTRLIVGTDAFMVSAPQALREFVFSGPESSIAFGQAVNSGDCIMITGQAGGRQVQLAITGDNLPDIWRALAATGAALMLRVVNSESSGACRARPVLPAGRGPVQGGVRRRDAATAAAVCAHPRHRGRRVHPDADVQVGSHFGCLAGQVRSTLGRGPVVVAGAERPGSAAISRRRRCLGSYAAIEIKGAAYESTTLARYCKPSAQPVFCLR